MRVLFHLKTLNSDLDCLPGVCHLQHVTQLKVIRAAPLGDVGISGLLCEVTCVHI